MPRIDGIRENNSVIIALNMNAIKAVLEVFAVYILARNVGAPISLSAEATIRDTAANMPVDPSP